MVSLQENVSFLLRKMLKALDILIFLKYEEVLKSSKSTQKVLRKERRDIWSENFSILLHILEISKYPMHSTSFTQQK